MTTNNLVERPTALEQIVRFLDAHAGEQIRFVRDLCDENSYTHNKHGTDRVGQMLCARLRGILPRHEVIRQRETGDHHVLRTAREAPRSIYLVGHMDTVFPPDHPFQTCRLEGEDILAGPGCGDMKGGLAVIVYALRALHEIQVLEDLPLAVIFNADEEIGSVHSRPLFLAERAKAEICLVAECAGKRGEVVVSRNGKMGARVDCFGQDRHVGSGTHEKASAILELAHKVIALEGLNACLPGVSLNVGKIEGGLSATTVPALAACWLDIRWEREEHKETLMRAVHEKLSEPAQAGCRLALEVLNSRPAMPLHGGAEQLFRVVREAGGRIGLEVGPEHRRGTSDANFFGSAGVPTLDGFGPISDKDHTPQEYIQIGSLKQRSALLAAVLLEYGLSRGMLPQARMSEMCCERRSS